MSLAFNSGGLITRGYGDNHRIITRGFGVRFDFGGYPGKISKQKSAQYFLDLFSPLTRLNQTKLTIYSPVMMIKTIGLSISTNINKSISESFYMKARVDYNRLIEILDEL